MALQPYRQSSSIPWTLVIAVTPDTGNIIPALFIETVTIHHDEKVIMTCDWSRAISKNPYLSFSFSDANPGDTLRISWQDSQGNTESKEAVIQ